ncbi:MAG: hypothetical protein PHF11_02870, partial [Candidatus Omnitrophica bacterium]|nr:hypothetical protein [Candidatus Omnitrophota bacterium]
MEAIKDTLESVMRAWEKKLLKPGTGDNPELLLKKFLTKKELGHIKFRYFKKGIITFDVDSSSWLYYFNLKKENLLAGLQRECAAV